MLAEYFNTGSSFVGNPSANVHDVILQGLDQSLEYSGKSVFYPVEPFQEHLNSWNGIDAVYVPNGIHIPTSEYNADSEAALAKYGGQVVGSFMNSKIITAGQARLQSQVNITNPDVEQAIQKGKIRVSSSFNAGGIDSIQSPILPSYVLLFDKTKANPRDKTSMFLNSQDPSEETDMTEEAVKIANLERDLSDEKATVERLNTEADGKDAQVVELNGTIERLNSEAETKDAKITSLETELTEFKNSEANMQWEGLKATRIPKGLVAKEEDEKVLRELYNTNKDAFYSKLMDVARPPETGREGTEYNNASGKSNEAAYEDLMISEVE